MQLLGIAAIAALCVSPLLLIAAEPPPKVVTFNASVRVDVDATGKPIKVEAPADLPQPIREYIEKRVASWQYEPARQDGVVTSATTFVQVGACAMPLPAGDGFSLGLDFKGNGPGLISASGQLQPLPYPRELRQQGAQGAFTVSFTVEPDGSTRLDDIESADGSKKLERAFRPALTKWIEHIRYQPEVVGGHAVRTQISYPVEFLLGGAAPDSAWRENHVADWKARAIASTECKLAASASYGPLPIALDSPIKVTPTPAS